MLKLFLAIVFVFSLCSCNRNDSPEKTDSSIHFTSMLSEVTGINFSNVITETDSVNLISNAYSYMGSGVGVGDFNNDGLSDLVFGSNMGSSKIYKNEGNLKFTDVTEVAGLRTDSWVTGVCIVDINQDGLDDIYLCNSFWFDEKRRENKLFVNQGNLRFREMSAAYGLNDNGFSSQAVFLDYDRDGDLDVYVLNHYSDHTNANNIVKVNYSGKLPAGDKLYRNRGVDKQKGHPVFEDVSGEAGIIENGYGLGVVVTDANADGWPDIYVANDYIGSDILWQNNRNGTFSNVAPRSVKHQSYSSMGVDANDINNDGLSDIISLDMMPEQNYRRKMMYSFLNYDRYVMERTAGYEPQFIRNMVQINNGTRNVNDTVLPFFSEVGQLTGLSETDWSWSVLMADFDNDGLKDVHITNGMGKDMINSDFITYYAASVKHPVSNPQDFYKNIRNKLNEYGSVELNNYCFKNNGNLNFTDVSSRAGLGGPAISSGCAYADLDNDGDLDLVVNNINRKVFILKNDARTNARDTGANFIRFKLNGSKSNLNGLGARLTIYTKGGLQTVENYPVRGYLSSVEDYVHFGIGENRIVDSIRILWPDQTTQLLINITANSIVEVNQSEAIPYHQPDKVIHQLVSDITERELFPFKHSETFFYDYGYQQLLPQRYSHLGPILTVGDINGDNLLDVFVGGAKNQSGRFFIQQASGMFSIKDLEGRKPQEDLGCLLFDADGDKDNDLFVNSGGNEYDETSVNYSPRLYKNDGNGNFSLDGEALPKTIQTSAQCVAAQDYDGDGDTDLFIGGRLTPHRFPVIPTSYLLRNDGGRFSIVTQEICPELENAGMVTSAQWMDFDNDKIFDLVVAGEWMPVRFFKNTGSRFKEVTSAEIKELSGQWRSLQSADVDNDGDPDLIAGNIGLNHSYKVSHEYPIKLFAKDFDGNGSIDPILAYYRINEKGERKLFPAISREQFAAQVPLVKKKFLYNKDYALADMDAVLKGADEEAIQELTCAETRTVWFENKGDGRFVANPLPMEAQMAPVNTILITDINGDGSSDLILAGNEYQTEVMTGRYDASYGVILTGDAKGHFTPVRPVDSGFIIDGDIRDLKLLKLGNGDRLILGAINDEQLKSFKLIK